MTLPKYSSGAWEKQLTKTEMQALAKQFHKEYDFLYENDDMVVGYRDALEFGDELIKEHCPILSQFINYRNDVLSSDREVAAFAFAVVELEWR